MKTVTNKAATSYKTSACPHPCIVCAYVHTYVRTHEAMKAARYGFQSPAGHEWRIALVHTLKSPAYRMRDLLTTAPVTMHKLLSRKFYKVMSGVYVRMYIL